MSALDDFRDGFLEEPGYLDYARIGPLSRAVLDELTVQNSLLAGARFGSLERLMGEGERLRLAVSELTGFAADQIVFQPSTGHGLTQALFGLTGGVLLSPAEFPTLPFAAVRSAESLHVVRPLWLSTEHGMVTPGEIRAQLTDEVEAVAVSLVDFRTGYLADLEGIRQVIGDRLLIVDAVQGFGVVDAPYEVADVVASGGQKWVRAGAGTGFLALSDRAAERLTPVFSGPAGSAAESLDEVTPPERGAAGFAVSHPDPIAEARFAAALEQLLAAGVEEIHHAVVQAAGQLIGLADEFAIPVASPRSDSERAGIVVLEPRADTLTVFTAALFNHGITATVRQGKVRLSAHAGTAKATFEMLRHALVSYTDAAR